LNVNAAGFRRPDQAALQRLIEAVYLESDVRSGFS
jgi:hypothetical protein